ncbi:phospholipid-translocating p-type flippase family protein, putative [Ichthyophthirius multifiliis]|uniref:Phospholipid-transporting ATPase n=1 Tax=Ichthyophthirius multifiliis TaxID=5932 RepID=G0QRG7_ICHMU|nr:phospholipid-translocating p-type flippase family protein, putative [Ichthyophthirius multifiliis]EGR32202.1 phospholipid-translocating p-type flippase family protein, putative [Ichthyophthirius multifiliis]|eukprot:XP_004035688.1 phospholipid-translocating p-type flippase family protein, putative [Ichthyophthirius multifiliis]
MCLNRQPLQYNQPRKIKINIKKEDKNKKTQFPSNFIVSSHYTIYNFLPLSLLLQFQRHANIYFLFIAILQSIPIVSPLNPVSAIFPLVFVLGLSIIREGLEDYYRHKYDKQVNSSISTQLILDENNKFYEQNITWANVEVGNLIKVKNNESFPADLLVLDSAFENGICYIETGALDGEKNLKQKQAIKETIQIFKNYNLNVLEQMILGYEQPNQNLYRLEDQNILLQNNNYETSSKFVSQQQSNNICKKLLITVKQLLPRGAFLRNTEYVIACVIYTGNDTKIMKNSENNKNKVSNVEKVMNIFILGILFFQILCSILTALLNNFYISNNEVNHWYLKDEKNPSSYSISSLLRFFTYFLLYNTMIPISLIVSLEIVKVTQGFFIQNDIEMYCKQKDVWPKVLTTTINEELGQVEYIFTDKTGTLTCNQMIFAKSVIGERLYQNQQENDSQEFKNQELQFLLENKEGDFAQSLILKSEDEKQNYVLNFQNELAYEYFQLISCTHECVIQKDTENKTNVEYQGPSPDEIALVSTANCIGFKFLGIFNDFIKLKILGNDKKIELLYIFQFDSTRKRMSVIVNDQGVYKMYIKGADNIIKQRLNYSQLFLKQIDTYLEQFSLIGLRTLMLAMKILSEEEFLIIKSKYESFLDSQNREEQLNQLADEIENNFILIGATAVEDKLQDKVAETIQDLIKAQIKIWMLTGDKLETAENIAKSCNLIQNQMLIIKIQEQDKDLLKKVLQGEILEIIQYCLLNKQQKCIVIEGESLVTIFNDKELQNNFLQISKYCESVVCCRVTPKQKAECVRMVKLGLNKITLAIGDGANDVNMIQEANIGCGIFGNEGMQAAQNSDFSFGEFKCLWRLLLIHGRWSYIRISEMILYFFYKNIGQTIFDDIYITLYNLSFTAGPLVFRAIFDQDVIQMIFGNSL